MDFLVVFVVIGILVLVGLTDPIFMNWLKGSRKTYYLGQDGLVACSPKKLRTPTDRVGTNMKPSNQGVIEISHGWFRHPSAIYGDYHVALWQISKYWRWVDGDVRDCVSLTDNRGLRVEIALQMINTYPSLQAMLYRIAELERSLSQSEDRRLEWRAAVRAVLRLINLDRQQYRSKSSEKIRLWLEAIEKAARDHKELSPHTGKEDAWVRDLPYLVEDQV